MKNLYSSVTLFYPQQLAEAKDTEHTTHFTNNNKKKCSAQAGDDGSLLEMQTQNIQVINPELLQQYHSTQHTK